MGRGTVGKDKVAVGRGVVTVGREAGPVGRGAVVVGKDRVATGRCTVRVGSAGKVADGIAVALVSAARACPRVKGLGSAASDCLPVAPSGARQRGWV